MGSCLGTPLPHCIQGFSGDPMCSTSVICHLLPSIPNPSPNLHLCLAPFDGLSFHYCQGHLPLCPGEEGHPQPQLNSLSERQDVLYWLSPEVDSGCTSSGQCPPHHNLTPRSGESREGLSSRRSWWEACCAVETVAASAHPGLLGLSCLDPTVSLSSHLSLALQVVDSVFGGCPSFGSHVFKF